MTKIKEYIRDGRAPIPVNEATSRIMSSIKAKNTSPELKLRKALWYNGIKGYRIHWKKVPGSPDIVFPRYQLAIFVHGCFWHRCPFCNPPMPKTHLEFWIRKFDKNIKRDKFKNKQLAKIGWKTLTLWECQINNNCQSSVNKIKNRLKIK